jgi:SAM-dependent methyltransferase
MPEPIYRRPDAYDLEHEGDTEDIDFFVRWTVAQQPKRVLELACGDGRVTLPLAECGADHGFDVVGLEFVPEMLDRARARREQASTAVRDRLQLLEGNMRTWRAEQPFDLILTPCSSMCHLLALDDQIAAWQAANANVRTGGRFVVDVSMPNFAAYADSFTTPPRAFLEVDRDTRNPDTNERLIRCKTTLYVAHEQRAEIRYFYDLFEGDTAKERFVSDYESHIYFPRELQLLFLAAGFHVESILGDYHGSPLGPHSRQIIVVGIKD